MPLSTSPGQQVRPIFVFGTYVLPVGVNLISEEPRAHETVRDMANASSVVLRQYVPGLPDVITSEGSVRVRIPRAAKDATAYRKVNILRAWSGNVSYCRFKEVTEVFTYDGSTGLKLLRRPFLMATHGLDAAYWPVLAATNYATTATVNGTSATVSLGTPDALKRVPFTTTPAYAAQGDVVVVHYTPYFYCHVLHAEGEGRSFEPQNAFQEERFVRLREVNGA